MPKPPLPRSLTPLDRALGPLHEFLMWESAGGVLLMVCAVAGLVWANWPGSDSYAHAWHVVLSVSAGGFALSQSLQHWINDLLMAVFFFLVGLEIKRELLIGELASPRKALLPIAAALGGMIVPALLYTAVNRGGPGAPGWGIPMATDIAFAIGVLSLLGPRVPLPVKVFLTALAIVDDLGAVLVIAIFYTAQLSFTALGIAALLFLLMLALNRLRVRNSIPYLIVGAGLWLAVYQSGVHSTIAGVLAALAIPSAAADGERSLMLRLEHALLPWVNFLIMPLFALANAGVAIHGAEALQDPVALGIGAGLVLGKPVGIVLAAWLAVKSRLAALPQDTRWMHLWGAGLLGGIGFTMSIFIAGLAFDGGEHLDAAKLGILGASLMAGVAGWVVLRWLPARR